MTLRVALPQHAGPVHWTALVAAAEGLYAAEGLDVEQRRMPHDDQSRGLLSGETPIERRTPDEDITFIEAGKPIRIVAGIVCKPPAWIYGAPGVRGFDDVRGAAVAGVSERFGSSLALRMVLADAGLAPGDYVLESVGGTVQRYRALREGRVAATILTPPTSFAAEREGLPLLASLPEWYPRFMYSAVQANTIYAAAHRDEIVRYLRAEIRAQRLLADPAYADRAVAVLAQDTGMSATDARACYAQAVERDRIFCVEAAIAPDDLADVVAGLRRLGECVPQRSPADYIDGTFLEEARAS